MYSYLNGYRSVCAFCLGIILHAAGYCVNIRVDYAAVLNAFLVVIALHISQCVLVCVLA